MMAIYYFFLNHVRSSSPINPLTRNLCRSSCKFLIVSLVPSLLLLLPLFFISLDFFFWFFFYYFFVLLQIKKRGLIPHRNNALISTNLFNHSHDRWCWGCLPDLSLWLRSQGHTQTLAVSLTNVSPLSAARFSSHFFLPRPCITLIHLLLPVSLQYSLLLFGRPLCFCLPPAATPAACLQTPWARRQSRCCQVYSSWAVFSASWRSLSLLSVLFCTSKHSFLFCRSMRWQWYCPPIPLATLSWCGALALAGHHKKNLCPFLLDGPYFSTHSLSSYLQSPGLLRKDRMVVFCLWYWSTSKPLLQSRSLQTNISTRWCLPKTTYNWSARQKTRRETTGSQHTGN